jgi:hypothetical protein
MPCGKSLIDERPQIFANHLGAVIECHPLSFDVMQRRTILDLVPGFVTTGPVEINSAARKLAQVLEPICRDIKTLY